jgi:CheY-like chemotaxis protein
MRLALRDVRFRGNADIEGPVVGPPKLLILCQKAKLCDEGHIAFAQSSLVLQTTALQRITDAAGASIILILSDINMPGMSGLEMLPKAKAIRPDVPVIMITAYGDAETKRKALESGAEALFTKPIDFLLLRNEIDTRVEQAA